MIQSTPKLTKDYMFNPLPKGWFVAAFSEEVERKAILSTRFLDKEVVLFRTESGKVNMVDAYCPHMGAHFGFGGTVEGELIRCPFHGFSFNGDGKCVKNEYGTKPSPRACMKSWATKEMHGVILAYNHPEEHVPSWTVPDLDEDGWTKPRYHHWVLNSNSQETAENAVDIGHFRAVHGYDSVEVMKPLILDGPFLNAGYAMTRKAGFLGRTNIRAEFEIYKYGLGYSCVEAHTLDFDLRTRHFVFVTPIDGKNVNLRIGVSLNKNFKKKKVNPALLILPKSIVEEIIMKMTLRSYKHDVSQDFLIWKNKKYIHPPALSQGDGPIVQFREWAMQFD